MTPTVLIGKAHAAESDITAVLQSFLLAHRPAIAMTIFVAMLVLLTVASK